MEESKYWRKERVNLPGRRAEKKFNLFLDGSKSYLKKRIIVLVLIKKMGVSFKTL